MLTYNEIKTELAAGLTVEQIVAKYSADLRTVTNIDADKLQTLLIRYMLIYQDYTQDPPVWTGSLLTAIESTGNVALIAGVNLLLNQLNKPGRVIVETTIPDYGQLLAAILQVSQATLPENTYTILSSELMTMCGGFRYGPQVTVEAVQELIIAGELAQWKSDMIRQATNAQALFISRSDQSTTQWDAEEIAFQWAKAYEDA